MRPFVILALLIGCSTSEKQNTPQVQTPPTEASEAEEEKAKIVVLGDSISAGYGLPEDQSWPSVMGAELEKAGHPVQIINAGQSGDTSAGGLRRLSWLLKQNPDLLILELGGNDALRGQPLESIEENLGKTIELCKEAGVDVILAGMRIPTNYGPEYTEGFAALFPKLAEKHGAGLIPFLLDDVGGKPELNLPDGIHPTAEGQKILAGNAIPLVKSWLETNQ